MRLGIVVLNWNGKEVTPRCLDSIYRSTYLPDSTVVVDNASIDGSRDVIRKRFPQAVLIENDSNLGFAEGCNIGIRYLLEREFELILILNNDTEVDAKCLHELCRAAASHPAAAYAATIYEHENHGTVWYGGGTISRLTLEARHETRPADGPGLPRPTEFITGCCMLFRSEALKHIGLLDPDFFAYYEDVDWCLRAKASGCNLLHVPKAAVYHDVSHSFRRAGSNQDGSTRFSWAQKRPVVLHLSYRNRLLLARKHSKSIVHFLFLGLRCVGRAVIHGGLLFLIGQTERGQAVISGVRKGLSKDPMRPRVHSNP